MGFSAPDDASASDPLPFLLRFQAAFARGDLTDALNTASEACYAAPAAPESHYAYGQAWAAMGKPAHAAQAFAVALRLRPRWADAWVNFGLARYRMNAVEDARDAMEQALLAEPNHLAALGNLGAFLRLAGESERAEALLRQALTLEPGNFTARLNLAADLLGEERTREALALLQEAALPDDIHAARHWRLQEALGWLQLRDAAKARETLAAFENLGPTPPALEPLLRWRRVLLAQLNGDAAQAQGEALATEAALAVEAPDALPEHRVMAHFDLAKFWSSQDRRAEAFENWRQGHRLLAASQPFARANHKAFIDASIDAFPAERFASGARAANADPTPVFIVGMPRSGTTLCEQILAAHRDAFGAGERTALGRLFHRLGGGEGPEAVRRIAALNGSELDAAASEYLAQMKALAPGAKRIIDKMPANYLYLGLVALMFPRARIIHCERDPRDIGLSIFTFRFHGHHAYAHDLADLGWTIGEQMRLMDHWKTILPGAILPVRLADWVDDFAATLARVLDHIGLPDDTNCLRFHEAESRVRTVSRAQVRQPVNARGLGRWRAYEAQLAPLIGELEKAKKLSAN